MINDYDGEYEPICDCGKIDCPQCNGENYRPITEEEAQAQELLKDKNFITIENKSYRYEGILENNNVDLISNDDDENNFELNIREVYFIEGNTINFKDQDDNGYTATIEDEEE
jgi:hypothetical protein